MYRRGSTKADKRVWGSNGMTTRGGRTREEHDYLGPLGVLADAYYGAQTQRVACSFPISGVRVHPHLVHAAACVKKPRR